MGKEKQSENWQGLFPRAHGRTKEINFHC